MNDSQLMDTYKNLLAYGRVCFGGILSKYNMEEDFASWTIIRIIQGRKSPFKYFAIDFIRMYIGDKRSKKFESSKSIKAPTMLFQNMIDHYESIQETLNDVLPQLDNRERIVFILLVKWKFHYAEIAELLNCSTASISYLVDDIREKIFALK